MSILVTGASGFIGAALCESLAARGERTIGVDRQPPAGGFGQENVGFTFQAVDLRETNALAGLLEELAVDRVVIGAAVTADAARERSDPAGVIAVNVGSVAETIRSAARAGVKRVVYLSSGGIYGDSAAGTEPLVEDATPLRPRSLYAITKQAGEACALRLGESFGLDVIAARVGTCFGPFERDTGVRDTLSAPFQALQLAMAGMPARLPRPARRDWLYVRDAVAGILALVDTPALSHRVYNVAAGFEWSLAEWCQHLERRYSQFSWSITHPDEANINLYDGFDRAPMSIARLTTDTGFRPRYDLAAAATDFLDRVPSDLPSRPIAIHA
jgi:UDP-glucuronate 4-epimerase